MDKPTILYVFRRPVKKQLTGVKTHSVPEDILYGFTRLKSFRAIVTDKVFELHHTMLLQKIFDILAKPLTGVGFSLFPCFALLSQARKADLVFATVDSYSLPLALFKKMGIFKTPLIINTTGLYDGLKKLNPIQRTVYRTFIDVVDFFICGQSFQECQKLSQLLSISIKKFAFIPFGIDTAFFKPTSKKEGEEILTIGADPTRDWQLYATVATQMPEEKFIIVTYKGLVNVPMPVNVRFMYNLDYQTLREQIWKAKIILILSRDNFHFAGQSTIFRCMASGKPVIFSKTPGVSEYTFRNTVHCIMVPPQDPEAVISAIELLRSLSIRKAMGKKARSIILNHYGLRQYYLGLERIFARVL